jgi:hypothetical protein
METTGKNKQTRTKKKKKKETRTKKETRSEKKNVTERPALKNTQTKYFVVRKNKNGGWLRLVFRLLASIVEAPWHGAGLRASRLDAGQEMLEGVVVERPAFKNTQQNGNNTQRKTNKKRKRKKGNKKTGVHVQLALFLEPRASVPLTQDLELGPVCGYLLRETQLRRDGAIRSGLLVLGAGRRRGSNLSPLVSDLWIDRGLKPISGLGTSQNRRRTPRRLGSIQVLAKFSGSIQVQASVRRSAAGGEDERPAQTRAICVCTGR